MFKPYIIVVLFTFFCSKLYNINTKIIIATTKSKRSINLNSFSAKPKSYQVKLINKTNEDKDYTYRSK